MDGRGRGEGMMSANESASVAEMPLKTTGAIFACSMLGDDDRAMKMVSCSRDWKHYNAGSAPKPCHGRRKEKRGG